MNTAMLFGSLFFGGWALRGSPSASAGPPMLWRRPSARRRVACGGVVCGGGTTGSRRNDVVDVYEERRRSHRRHTRPREGGPSRRRRPQDALRIAMAEMPELQDVPAADTDAPLKVKVTPPSPILKKIVAKRDEKKRLAKRARAKENDAPEKKLRGADEATGVLVAVPPVRQPFATLAEAMASPRLKDCASNPLDCFCFQNYDQYDAARAYLKTLSIGGKNGEVLLVSNTEDIFADITLDHKLISQHWPDCYEDARSAAPTPYSIYRISRKVCSRMQTLNANPDAKSHPLDDFCRRMAVRFTALGWTGTHKGLVEGNFARLANATQTSRGSHGVYIDTMPLSRLIYKGSQISIRTGSMPKWIRQRFSCSFARYSTDQRDELELDWAAAYFGGKEELCPALAEPRRARSRLKHVFAKPLRKKSVVVVCVSGPDFQRVFLARNKYVGAVFDAAGLDATDKSLPYAIVPRGRPAPVGYFGRFEEAHPTAALLYGALDGFGQIRKIKRTASAKSPAVHEYNQVVVPLNVHDGMASGFTDVAKGVEYGVLTVANNVWTFHGSKDTLENIYKWPASFPLARALMEKTGLTDLSQIRLAPAKPTEIVNDGSRGKRCMPVDALTTATDGTKRIKTKTEGKPSKKLRCLNPASSRCGDEMPYRGTKGKVAVESGAARCACKRCGLTGFIKCVGPGW
jgi:hypothetical protein